jgi:hypothetical protein
VEQEDPKGINNKISSTQIILKYWWPAWLKEKNHSWSCRRIVNFTNTQRCKSRLNLLEFLLPVKDSPQPSKLLDESIELKLETIKQTFSNYHEDSELEYTFESNRIEEYLTLSETNLVVNGQTVGKTCANTWKH